MNKIRKYIKNKNVPLLNIINENEIYFNCSECSTIIKTSYKNIKRRIRENKLFLCKSCYLSGSRNPSYQKNPYINLSQDKIINLLKIKSDNAKNNNLHKFGYNSQKRFSSIHQQLINILSDLGIKDKFESEYNLGKYYYDECSEYLSLIFEVNGDYYHANPNIYKSDDYIKGKWKSYYACEKWNYDKEKTDYANKYGFKVIPLWESDFKSGKIKEIVTNKIKELE